MTRAFKGEGLFLNCKPMRGSRCLMLLSSGAAMVLNCFQAPATASSLIAQEIRDNVVRTKIELMPVTEVPAPELPPIGDMAKYIPPEDLYPPVAIPSGTHLVLRLSDRRVYVYRDNQVQASYPVAVGKEGWETPTGTFEVMQMVRDPRWQSPWTGEVLPPGPDSPLGLRWIGFWTDGTNLIGFHGTPTLDSIGQAASHGCVRMRNEDVIALFEQVEIGTTVVVEP